MSSLRRASLAAVACVLLVPVVTVRATRAAGEQSPAPTKAPTAPAELKALEYRLLGPAAGGRVSRVAGIPGDPATYYAATASGGVWKSTDSGVTWASIFDDQPISSIEPERNLRGLG